MTTLGDPSPDTANAVPDGIALSSSQKRMPGNSPHNEIMTSESDPLPVLVIDGAAFSDFDGFTREFSRLLAHERKLLGR